MRILLISLCIITALAALGAEAFAQPYSGDIYSVNTAGTLFRVQRNGTTTSLTSSASTGHGITMSYNNQAIYWSGAGNAASTASINSWQNNANTVLLSTTDFSIDEIEVNQNGEIAFTGRDVSKTPTVTGLFKWVGGSNITTIVTTSKLGTFTSSLNGGLDINVNTGNYILPPAAFQIGQMYDVAEDGTVNTLIVQPRYRNAYTISQDRRDGVIFRSGTSFYSLINNNGTTTSLTPTGGSSPQYHCIRIDRSSTNDNSRQLYAVYHSTSTAQNYLHRIANPRTNPVVTSTALSTTGSLTSSGMVFDGERNIASAKLGPGQYDLNFSFRGEGGNPYVVGVSASGYKPGIRASGLNIGLNLDNLVVLSLQNALRPYFDPGPGTLNGIGSARGGIALGRDNLGLVVHIVAATFVNNQIRTISEPHPMRL